MKSKIFFLSIFLIFISCREYKFSKLIVNIDNESKNSGNLPLNKLSIYKNGKLYKEILGNDGLFIESPIKLDSIEKGKYEFEYSNLFGERTKKEFRINNRKETDTISIFPDQFDFEKYLSKSIIKNLKNESVKINYNSQGCFHKISDSITIRNESENYFITHGGKTKKINEKQLYEIEKLECQLYAIPKDGLCTTTEIYTITYKNKKQVIKNGYCVWSGWNNLEEKLLKGK